MFLEREKVYWINNVLIHNEIYLKCIKRRLSYATLLKLKNIFGFKLLDIQVSLSPSLTISRNEKKLFIFFFKLKVWYFLFFLFWKFYSGKFCLEEKTKKFIIRILKQKIYMYNNLLKIYHKKRYQIVLKIQWNCIEFYLNTFDLNNMY